MALDFIAVEEDDNGTETSRETYTFIHPDYVKKITQPEKVSNNNGAEFEGPIKALAFGTDSGCINAIQFWWCDAKDPNEFYGCSYPEIWKLGSAVSGALFLILWGVVFIVAQNKSPFVKVKEQLPIENTLAKLWSDVDEELEIAEENWNDLETLSVAILQ